MSRICIFLTLLNITITRMFSIVRNICVQIQKADEEILKESTQT